MIWFFQYLQSQHDELETKFLEERAQLEAKYQKLYEPLYTKVSVLLICYDIRSNFLTELLAASQWLKTYFLCWFFMVIEV